MSTAMTGKQLKNSILQLAIQGKLVPQDPNDEPASVLLQRIRKEKEQLVKEGKLKKKDLVSEPIADEEKPFEIPESWVWCRLGEIITMLSGQDYAPSGYNDQHNGIPYITGASNLKDRKLIVNRWTSIPSIKASYGDLLVVCKGSGVGKMAYCTEQEVHIARQIQCIKNSFKAIHLGYIEGCITYFLEEVIGQANGLIPGISRDVLLFHILPLPPLSEQHRIVAKIEELMPLVEEYDKAQTKLDALNKNLPDALKKSILQEAIQGKLVPQDPNDEPASVLLQRIRKEKEQLVKEGRLKKKDLISEPIADEEKPFEIPEGWEWCRLSNVGVTNTGTTPSKSNTDFFGNYIPFLGPGDIKNTAITYGKNGLSKLGYEVARPVPANTIIQVCIGGSIGKCAIVDRESTFNQQINSLTTLFCDHKYLFYCMQSDFFTKSMIDNSTGTATPIINKGLWDLLLIPLPPLSEQHRIVAKIDELFSAIGIR